MRRRFALPPFSDDERDRLTAAIAPLAERADAALDEILARPPSAASAPPGAVRARRGPQSVIVTFSS